MPLVYQQSINNHTSIALWLITEDEVFFEHIPLQREITNPHKRLQHLAGRHLLLLLEPNIPLADIKVASTRKPFLPKEPFHFSISHCGNYAAVIVSKENRVGVDVEVISDKAFRLARKFLSPAEMSILPYGALPKFYTLAWSVKEALFKWDGNGGVDFKRDLPIQAFTSEKNGGHAICFFKKQEWLRVDYIQWEDHFLSWIV